MERKRRLSVEIDIQHHLRALESESIYILREMSAQFRNPVLLYSVGKDSSVLLHLSIKAFYPSKIPFSLLHVDTTWEFQSLINFRNRRAQECGFHLIAHINEEGLATGVSPITHNTSIYTNIMKTQGLKQALDKYGFDAAAGGARRDEEKSRAKERIFSLRSATHGWDPRNQRPEFWSVFNGRLSQGQTMRVFPLSNWTELDVWRYIQLEKIPVVDLYFAKERPVVYRNQNIIVVDDERLPLLQNETPAMQSVRFRTLGCYPLTGAIPSTAKTVDDIVNELTTSRNSEREGRMIDHDPSDTMELKKREGYF
jgi:sulfate adenylyltransferase subunit 2